MNDSNKLFTLEQIKYRALNVKIDHEVETNDRYLNARFDGLCLGLDALIDELEEFKKWI